MTNILHLLRYVPKSLAVYVAVVFALFTSVIAVAATQVQIEGNLGVANFTSGDTSYSTSVEAAYDDVVKFKVYYHNLELPDSGNIAENLSVKIDMPTDPGMNQTVTATIKGDNTNTIVDTATVNLDRDDAYLEFIPGSVDWKHNVGTADNVQYETVNILDDVVTSDGFVTIENAKPCYEFEAWITFFARVKVPGVELDKQVKVNDQAEWTDDAVANSGDSVRYLLTVRNQGNTVLNNIHLRDLLPEELTYKEGSSTLFNGNHPNGLQLSDKVIETSGVNIGGLAVGATAYVTFETTVKDIEYLECGTNELVNKVTMIADELPQGVQATSTLSVDKTCEQEEFVFECTALTLDLNRDKREVTATAEINKSDNVELVGVEIDFGDGTVITENGATHTYSEDGEYTITATVAFQLDNTDKTVEEVTCASTVTFETPEDPEKCPIPGKTHLDEDDPECKEDETPDELPDTGAGNIIGALFGTGTTFAAARSWLTSRRVLRESLLA